MTSRFRFFFVLLLSTILGFVNETEAADPSIRWEQIETPHFRILFDSRHYPLAQLYARYAEQGFNAASPLFGQWPEKTTIIIDDSSDVANGFATGVPYPMISTFPVLPTSLDSISDYGNWGLELLTHEYTHVLTFEPATGFMRPLRYVFGTIVRPNILMPRWYTEGIATELETRLSSYGRLRSANYVSIVRAMAEEGKLRNEDISRINEVAIPDWPGGIRPYLMGALLWNELIRKGGEGIVKDLNLAYSRRIPFLLNGPLEDRLGVGYHDFLLQVYDRVEDNVRKQIQAIHLAGTIKQERFQQRGFFSHSPVVSPDGKKLAYIGKEHNVDSRIFVVERTGEKDSFLKGEAKPVGSFDYVNKLSWAPDSSAIYFDAVETYDRYYHFSDLWKYDLNTKKSTKLTRGLRLREPAVSPDGKWIVFSQNTPGSSQLAAISSEGGKDARVLYAPPIQTRIARPEFMSESEIVFTEKRDDGAEVLKTLRIQVSPEGLSAAAAEPTTVLAGFKPAHFPRPTQEGLLFVSDRSGVSNLYLASRDLSSARAVTNATTRVMTGELDPVTGELLYSRLDSSGPMLYASAREDWSKAPAQVPQVAPLIDSEWPKRQASEVEVRTEKEDYSPLPYLVPRYWMPYMFLIPEGVYLSASTAASDPVGRHSYALTAAYDSLTNKPSFFGQYVNNTWRKATWSLTVEDINEYIYSGGFNRHSTSAMAGAGFFLPKLSNNWKGGLSWQYLQSDLFGENLAHNGAQASLSWSNASRRGLEISPEKGGSFSLAHTHFFEGLGDISYDQTDFRGSYYFSRWLPERHALAFFSNATLAPALTETFLGRSTIGGNFNTGVIQTGFLMRGYNSGVFVGKNMVSGTAEYRFPLWYAYQGYGTAPFFVQRFHGALFVDALTLDGFSYDYGINRYRSQKLGRFFYGFGGEVRVDASAFYHVPFQLIVGAYYGTDRGANPAGLIPFVGIGL